MAIKKKLLNIVLLIKKFWEQMQKIKVGTCEEKKKEVLREYGKNKYKNITED